MKPCNITRWSKGGQEGSYEMTRPRKRKDYIPVTVPHAAIPAGETLIGLIQRSGNLECWTHSTLERKEGYFHECGFIGLNDALIRVVQSIGTY
jgi:hypothetical protein